MPPGNAAQVSISGFLGNVHNNSGLSALLGVCTKQNLMHGPQTITQLMFIEGDRLRRSSVSQFVPTRKLAPACCERTSLRLRFQVASREPRFLRREMQSGAELPLRAANSHRISRQEIGTDFESPGRGQVSCNRGKVILQLPLLRKVTGHNCVSLDSLLLLT